MTYRFYVAQSNANSMDYRFGEEANYFNDDFTNEYVERVTVRDKAAANEWKAAFSRYIHAAWTPNQNREERVENGQIIRNAQATMKYLEDAVKVFI